jgi:hypothetical protein
MGRQAPTFELRPGCFSCAAIEAIEFYESLGPRLDPWQKTSLEMGLGEDELGDWAAPEVGIEVQRQNGKGGITEAVELTGLFVWGEKVILHTAHLLDTSRAAFKRTLELVDGSDDLRRRVKRVSSTTVEESIELLTGGILKFKTRTGTGGRGLTGDRVTFDEAQEIKPEQMEALVPTILARPNPQIWYTFTIPKVAGFVSVLRKRAKAGEAGLAYREWTNPRGADLTDLQVLAQVNPAYGYRVSAKTLAIARGVLTEEGFGRECGGIWPLEASDRWRVISEEDWEAQRDPGSQLDGRPALGVWVPPDRSCAAIAAAGTRLGGGKHLEITGNDQVGVDFRPRTEWVVRRLLELESHRPLVVVIDDKALAEDAEAAGLVVYRATAADMVTGCQMLFDGVTAKRDTWHIGQKVLSDAIEGAEKRNVGGSWAFARVDVDVEVAPAASGALALAGAATPRLWRRDRQPGAAFVSAVPDRSGGVMRVPAAPRDEEDVTQQRLREQLERDLARR